MNEINKEEKKRSLYTFLSRRAEGKIKSLNLWKEKYLTTLKEVKEIGDSLNKIISENELGSKPKKSEEITKPWDFNTTEPGESIHFVKLLSDEALLKELRDRYKGGMLKVQIEGSRCQTEFAGKVEQIIFDDENINNKINIPKAPPPPTKKVEEIKKSPIVSRADLNREITEKIKEGVKPSDLKKQK